MANKQFALVLDRPALNPTADHSDDATVAELKAALGKNMSQAWALTRIDKEASAWIYPTSYHIKVAVQDSAKTWLSSGNSNNSNQPAIDPAGNAADATTARHRDRDWHVVISEPNLAKVFEAYLRNDLTVGRRTTTPRKHWERRCPRRRSRPVPPRRSSSSFPPPPSPTTSRSPRCLPRTPASTPTPSRHSSQAPPPTCTCNTNTSSCPRQSTPHHKPSSSSCRPSSTGRTPASMCGSS